MDNHESPQHFQDLQHYLQHHQQQQEETQASLQAIGLQMEKVGTQTLVTMFKPPNLQVLVSRLGFAEGKSFEFGLGNRLVYELGSFAKGSENPMTQINT
jgi:hypothetical protein